MPKIFSWLMFSCSMDERSFLIIFRVDHSSTKQILMITSDVLYTKSNAVSRGLTRMAFQNGIMNLANMQSFSFLSHVWKYLLAFLLIAFITTIFFLVRDVLDTTLIALLYLIPLGIITALWGLGPGISSALITFLTFNYFFIRPYYALTVHRPTDVVILVVFLVVAVVISQLVGQAQAGLASANAREREATQLYELSTALTGLHDDRTIAQILAKQVHAVAEGEYTQINITGGRSFTFHYPAGEQPARSAELIVPIE